MSEYYYQLPTYKNKKIYNPFRCPDCYKILRIKIFVENNMVKYNCQCKKDWLISYQIDKELPIIKPRKLDSIFNLRCSICNQYNNLGEKNLEKCSICETIFCVKENHKDKHDHTKIKNLTYLDAICEIHSKDFIAYCKICDKDLCELCVSEEKDNKHDIIYYKDILPKKEKFIENYNLFNEFSNKVVTQFKGVRRKTNTRLIYFFHFREIFRNCYINFSRYSKYNKFNFALIYNIFENSDFISDLTKFELILDYKLAPTCFLKSSKYFFSFLEENNNTKMNFFKNNQNCEIECMYSSFPYKKYFIIKAKTLQLYNSKTFELIYDIGNYYLGDKYNFEDERLICYFNSNKKHFLLITMNEEGKNKVKIDKFNYEFNNVYLFQNSFIIKFKNKFYIYDDKGNNKILTLFTHDIDDNAIKNIEIYCLSNYITYLHNNNIYFYDVTTEKRTQIEFKRSLFSIYKLNKKYIIIKSSNNIGSKDIFFYIINVPLKQIVNIYKFNEKLYNIEIMGEYFIRQRKKFFYETVFLNALTSKVKKKFINLQMSSNIDFENKNSKFIILSNYIIYCWNHKIISIKSY